MITTTRSRRLPVRACQARLALDDLGAQVELSRWLRGEHRFEVDQDRLACEVRHTVRLDPDLATRVWWYAIGRPRYDTFIEDVFDNLARVTGASVRRPVRWAPYSRMLRLVAPGRSRPRETPDAVRPDESLELAG